MTDNNNARAYLILAMLFQGIYSLSNLSVRIPEHIQKGQTADLTCSYNLGGDTLYSVKWYKGRHEFFRYMPHEYPAVKIFPVKGMKINMTASDQTRVVIEDVQINFSGTYLCEVTVTPSYYALMQFANMTVIDFPREGPTIESPRKQYQVGETAHLTCTAHQSSPPTSLAWYINGEPASEVYLRRFPTREGKQILGLSFPITGSHFVSQKKNKKSPNLHLLGKGSGEGEASSSFSVHDENSSDSSLSSTTDTLSSSAKTTTTVSSTISLLLTILCNIEDISNFLLN
ncbi:unnamed protein product [Lepeophtheirus salmonis]|uniref:(salmon louse) hypothetical protein n=1 Tax=Lepeophtheirus salmonis TaxID=72036 RepID=A0A7R8H4T4_LEPSM|nr:unnamed protein product [Lepeophtheirus salmonis]CAF2866239.1 unnamed protein product [Lepeophtheirus salmonis]